MPQMIAQGGGQKNPAGHSWGWAGRAARSLFSAFVNYKSQPSPKPSPCSQQSATQQQHVQSSQTHMPLWQQPQQSHTSQPACDATLVTTAIGARAITAHRIKLVMEKLLEKKGMNETLKRIDQTLIDPSAFQSLHTP